MDQIFAKFEDDQIRYQLLTKDYVEETLFVISRTFFLHENVCVAVGVPADPAAVEELLEIPKYAIKEGCTAIAVDKRTNKVVSVICNKIIVKGSPEDRQFFGNFAKNLKREASKAFLDFFRKAHRLADLFEILKTDCYLDLLIGATLPEYRKRGIAKKLRAISVEFAKKLLEGVNVKQAIDDGPQPSLEPVPTAVTSVFTSFITQRIAKQLGFEVAAELSFEDASIIGDHTATAQIAYKKLV